LYWAFEQRQLGTGRIGQRSGASDGTAIDDLR